MQIKRMKITLGRKKLHQRVSWVNMYIKWQATRWTACKGPGSSYESILVVKIVVENRNESYFSIRKRIIPIEINKQWSNKRNCRLFSAKWRDVFKIRCYIRTPGKTRFCACQVGTSLMRFFKSHPIVVFMARWKASFREIFLTVLELISTISLHYCGIWTLNDLVVPLATELCFLKATHRGNGG